MSRVLLFRLWAFARLRLVVVALVTFGWGWLVLFFYSQFSEAIRQLVTGNTLFRQFANFGSGDFFSVPGAVTLGTEHPFVIALIGIFAVGSGSVAIAGERQSGTLEIVLARPLARRAYLATHELVALAVVALLVAMLLAGMSVGALALGIDRDLDLGMMPLVWLNGFLLWGAFATFSLAASASFDRPGPAIGLAVAYLLVNYFLEILGSFWSAAQWTQEYSLFHHFESGQILTGNANLFDFALLATASAVPLLYALWVFPRRDLSAPA